MQELIAVIHAALASDATADQKAAGVQACNTIAAALGTEPGKQLVLPTTPPRSPLAGVSFDQVLDLAIAKLTTIASAREAQTPHALPSPPVAALPARTGLRVPARVALPPSLVRAASAPRSSNVARTNPARAPQPRTATTRPTTPNKH